MDEGESNKFCQKNIKKKIISGIVVVIIIVACIGLFLWKNQSNDEGQIESPTIIPTITAVDNNYSVIVDQIDMQIEMNITEWTEIEKLTFLITNGSVNGAVEYSFLKSIQHNESNIYNIASGDLTAALNDTQNDIIFYDLNNDGLLSVNDTFVIKGNTSLKMTGAINETGWIRIYIIFEGQYRHTQDLWLVLGYGQINRG